ncbi:MAG: hypothetical protein M0R66_01365 [Candidatus Omnitrophica bacterium]|nr:hypothetical protein [Candidatus Omnitrophota bacterium]
MVELKWYAGAEFPQLKLVSDELYESLLVRTLARAFRMGAIAAVAYAIADPSFVPRVASLVFAHDFAAVQVLVLPVLAAFFAAVEKVVRDAGNDPGKPNA